MDTELGTPGESVAQKTVRAPVDGGQLQLDIAGPVAVTSADVDGDGDLDLVTGSQADDELLIYWQERPGRFDPTPTVVGGPSLTADPFVVRAADLDGDGDMDLVSGNLATVTIFHQTAKRVFDFVPDALPILASHSLQLADLDGDGRTDIVAPQGDGLAVFWQASTGAFDSPATLVGQGLVVDWVQPADIDADGYVDLVTADGDGLSVFWQTSPRQFDPVPTIPGAYPTVPISFPLSVQVADFDGDGDLDLVAPSTGASLLFFWQTTSRAFDPLPTAVGSPIGLSFVQPADMDGDGDADVVAVDVQGVMVFWQTNPGEFDPLPTRLPDSAALFLPEPADIDGDGDLDLLATDYFGDRLRVLWQASRPALAQTPELLVGGPAMLMPEHIQAADLDGDGDLDLALATSVGGGSGELLVFWQASPGLFEPAPTAVASFPTIEDPVCVRLADIDGNGGLDLTCANYLSNGSTVFWQSSAGSFDPTPTVVPESHPFSAQVSDVDRDGKLDLMTTTREFLAIHWQQEARSFDPLATQLDSRGRVHQPDSVLVADLDADGKPDVFCADELAGNQVRIHWQTKPRTFDAQPTVIPSATTSLATADVDADGDLDIVANRADSLGVFWQSTPREFGLEPTILSMGGSTVEVVDVDGDGDLDLVSGALENPSGGTPTGFAVFRQTIQGSFDPTPFALGDFANTSTVAAQSIDLDGDGDTDLVSLTSAFGTASPGISVFWGGH
jgi:hypothetical protein